MNINIQIKQIGFTSTVTADGIVLYGDGILLLIWSNGFMDTHW